MRYKYKTTPYKYQVIALKKCLSQPNTALLLDPGLGKTKIAIDNISVRNLRDGLSRVLILAPKVVLGTWEQEIEKHMPDNIERYIFRLTGNDKNKRLQIIKEAINSSNKYPNALNIIIMTYDSLSIRKLCKEDKVEVYDEYNKLINKFNPEAIICDESQLIKSHSSKRSKSVFNLGKKASHRLILTGTMITKNPLDVFGQYRFLDSNIFGTRWRDFKDKYAIMGGYGGYQVVGYRHMDEFVKKVHSVAVRIRKEDALDLPDTITQVIKIDLDEKSRSIYDDLRKNDITTVNGYEIITDLPMIKAMRLHQICGGFIYTTDEDDNRISIPIGSQEKIKATTELASLRIEDGHKVVIYCKFINELLAIYNNLKEYNPLIIYGKSKDDYVDKAKKLFQNDDNYKVIIMQVSKGIGITLTAADVAIFHSLSYKYDDFKQCKDRLHRIGQNNKVTYYIMLAKNTVDNHVYQSVLDKKDFSQYVQDHKYIIFD